MNFKTSRRNFLRAGLGAGAVSVLGLGGYSSLIEPEYLRLERVRLSLPRLPARLNGFKIALISDLHFGPFTGEKEIGAAVEAVNKLEPDLVAITGDFVSQSWRGPSREPARFIEPCSHVLAGLHSRFGCFAVLGNHDHATDPKRISKTLQSSGIRLLSNGSQALERDGARLWIAGVDDAMNRLSNFDCALDGIPAREPVVLLAHEPDVADHSARLRIDLQLSGHSHGGQVRIPGVGAPYLPPLGRKYSAGLYRVREMFVYTTRGVGTVTLPFRFACPPEVTLLELESRRG